MKKANRKVSLAMLFALLPITASANQPNIDIKWCEVFKSIVEDDCTQSTPIDRARCVAGEFRKQIDDCTDLDLSTRSGLMKCIDRSLSRYECLDLDLSTRSGLMKCIDRFNRQFRYDCVDTNALQTQAEQDEANLISLIEEKFLTEQGPLKAQLAHEQLEQNKFNKVFQQHSSLLESRALETKSEIASSLAYKSKVSEWSNRLNDLLEESNSINDLATFKGIFLEIKEMQVDYKVDLNAYRDNLINVKTTNQRVEAELYSSLAKFSETPLADKIVSLNSSVLDSLLEEINEAKYALDRQVEFVSTMLGAKRKALISKNNNEEFAATIQDALFLDRSQSYLRKINDAVESMLRPEKSGFYRMAYQQGIVQSANRIVETANMCDRGGSQSWHSLGCNMAKKNLPRAQAFLDGRIESSIRFFLARMTDSENPDQLSSEKALIDMALSNGNLEDAAELFDELLNRYGG